MNFEEQKEFLDSLNEFEKEFYFISTKNQTNKSIQQLLKDGIVKLTDESCQGLKFNYEADKLLQQINLQIAGGKVYFNSETRDLWRKIEQKNHQGKTFSSINTILSIFQK